MLESTYALFGDYYRYQDSENIAFNKDLGSEAHERIQQLNRVLQKVSELEAKSQEDMDYRKEVLHRICTETPDLTDSTTWSNEHKKLYASLSDATRIQKYLEVTQELRDWIEAFYYFGFRARQVIRLLPELKNFECLGIRDVRNHLIEHPEGQSKVLQSSFAWGGGGGPVVKALRSAGQENVSVDRGLYINAQEFKDKLEAKLHIILRSV